MSKRGVFLALEGGEGVGKTTQIELLQEAIEARWGECVRTREPGGSAYAEAIRDLILHSDYAPEANAHTMFELFWAARADHVARTILPALSRGAHMITDRFDGTTWSHQIYGQECHELKQLFYLTRETFLQDQNACPDLYIFLDMDPEEGLRRVARRANEPTNHFDERKLDFHKRLREGCHIFADLFGGVLINADQKPEDVHADIMRAIEKRKLFSEKEEHKSDILCPA